MELKDKNDDDSTSAAVPVDLGGTASTTSGPSGGGASASGSFFDDNFASSLEDPPPGATRTNTGTGSSGGAGATATAAAGTAGPIHASGLLFGGIGIRNLEQYLYPTTGIGKTTGDEESRTSTFISIPSATSSTSLENIIAKCLEAHHFGQINPLGPVPRNSRSLAATSREIGPPEPTTDGLGGLARTAAWATVLGQDVTYRTTLVMRIPPSGSLDAYPTSMTYERVQPNFATARAILSYRPDRSVEKQAREVVLPNGRTKMTVQRYDTRNQPVGNEEVVREDPPVDVVALDVPPFGDADGAMTVTSDLTSRATEEPAALAAAAAAPALAKNRGVGGGNDAFELDGRIDEESSSIEEESDGVAYNNDQQVFAFTPPPPRLSSATVPAAAADGPNQLSDGSQRNKRKKERRTCAYAAFGAMALILVALAAGLGIALSSRAPPPPPPPTSRPLALPLPTPRPSPPPMLRPTRKPTRAPTAPLDPCFPNPCSNGGTCLPQPGTSGFACSCPPGYTGSRCATTTTTTNNNVAQCSFLNASPAQAKLLPNDGAGSDAFGRSVAIDGDTIVVGSVWDDNNGKDSGSAYVFTRESTRTAWRQQAKLLPDDGAANDYFGWSVAIDGDTIVVGAYWDDNNNGSNSGSAYVFAREGTGTAWRQQDKLLPDDGAANDWFGRSVAIDGDIIVVGALWDDDNGSASGSAYVFTREGTGTAWRQQAKLLADDGAANDQFGRSVAIDGDTIVVGAYWDDNNNGSDSGSAYVFTRESTGAAWKQQAKLLSDDGAEDDRFGSSVVIDGDTIVVGADGDDDNGIDSGSAYVFTRESASTAWRQQAKLLSNDGAKFDKFGISVAIDGDSIVVGARWDDNDNGSDSGSAYVFARERVGTAWSQQAKLLPNDGAADDWFGRSVAIDGDTIVVGADGDDDNGSESGSAYAFDFC